MSEPVYESIEVPGVGEVRARMGTSTLELAGAVKFWHDKYQSARADGFIAGAFFSPLFLGACYAVYYLLRNHG